MPNQNSSDPNQTNPNPTEPAAPVAPPAAPSVFPQSDLPPLPPSFQDVTESPIPSINNSPNQPITGSGSAAPPDIPPVIKPSPKKKFGGGRIIATILGIFLLVGGVGAGYLLTQQPQLFQQQASSLCKVPCPAGGHCVDGGETCIPPPPPAPPPPAPKPNPTPNCNTGNCHADCMCRGGGSGECTNQCGTTPTPNCNTGNCHADCMCRGGGSGECTNQCNVATPKPSCGDLICQAGETHASCPTDCPGNGDSCTGGRTCPNGYQCKSSSGGMTCQPNTDGSCKVGDPSAPVCCTPGVTCSSKTCEAPNRLECNTNGVYCTIQVGGCTGTPPPGNNKPTASCQNIKAYSSSYALLSASDFAKLTTGTQINFCVVGAASSGSFDKAMFTINGVQEAAATTVQRPGAKDFCQSYTIGATDTKVDVSAIIHHVTLGWF